MGQTVGVGETLAPLVVEDRPLVGLLYRLLFDGDLAPRRLEEVVEDLENLPAFATVRYGRPDLARYALGIADRVEATRRPPGGVERIR